jgi:RNA polymerase sigma-70 factor, ECF subfamily
MFLFGKTTFANCSDEELMQYIAKGEPRAFEVLYSRYSAPMYRFFYRMLWQDEALAQDFTQDIFLKIIEKSHLFDTKKQFSTWIYSIANNACKNAYRNKKPIENIDNQIIEYDDNFEFNYDKKLQYQHLTQAIEQLSFEHRECFVLRFLEDKSVKQIADIIGIAEGTVKSRLHHATQNVKRNIIATTT